MTVIWQKIKSQNMTVFVVVVFVVVFQKKKKKINAFNFIYESPAYKLRVTSSMMTLTVWSSIMWFVLCLFVPPLWQEVKAKTVKMFQFLQRILDWFKSLFWKEEMELTLVGLQYSGKTTFVNVIAVSAIIVELFFHPTHQNWFRIRYFVWIDI